MEVLRNRRIHINRAFQTICTLCICRSIPFSISMLFVVLICLNATLCVYYNHLAVYKITFCETYCIRRFKIFVVCWSFFYTSFIWEFVDFIWACSLNEPWKPRTFVYANNSTLDVNLLPTSPNGMRGNNKDTPLPTWPWQFSVNCNYVVKFVHFRLSATSLCYLGSTSAPFFLWCPEKGCINVLLIFSQDLPNPSQPFLHHVFLISFILHVL